MNVAAVTTQQAAARKQPARNRSCRGAASAAASVVLPCPINPTYKRREGRRGKEGGGTTGHFIQLVQCTPTRPARWTNPVIAAALALLLVLGIAPRTSTYRPSRIEQIGLGVPACGIREGRTCVDEGEDDGNGETAASQEGTRRQCRMSDSPPTFERTTTPPTFERRKCTYKMRLGVVRTKCGWV
eukprot:COSAG06_NODE_2048_length_7743_cov_19.099163_9_plen_185_part_00